MRIDSQLAATNALLHRPAAGKPATGTPANAKPASAEQTSTRPQPPTLKHLGPTKRLGPTPTPGSIATTRAAFKATISGVGRATAEAAPSVAGDETPNIAMQHDPQGGIPPGLTLEGLQRAWGTTDSPYDLNGDRTVDVDDLIQFLMNYPGAQPESSPAPVEPAPSVPVAQALPEAQPLEPTRLSEQNRGELDSQGLLSGVREHWGETGSPFDVNSDQVVDVDDLINVILNWPTTTPNMTADATGGPSSSEPTAASDATTLSDGGQTVAAETGRRLEHLTDRLLSRLSVAGFKSHLPNNLGQLLDQLQVDDRERRDMVQTLQDRFPAGIGVNVVG